MYMYLHSFHSKIYSACRDNPEIKFHLVNNMNELFLSHSVAPHRPEHICTSGPSTLMYLYCVTENQRRVQWLNCSTLSPQPINTSREIRVKSHFGIHDVCCMQHDNEQLVVTTHGHKGVSAYSTSTKKLRWHVEGKLPGIEREISAQGVAADGLGCLFVCDEHSKCIWMLSADGMYIGTVSIPERYGIPWRLRWSSISSSLLAVCFKERNYHICKLSIQKSVKNW